MNDKFGYGDRIRMNGKDGFVMCYDFPFYYDGCEHYQVIIEGKELYRGVADKELTLVKR